jgi:hypothetical protein
MSRGDVTRKWPPPRGDPETTKALRTQGFRKCAEEDSNFHPVIPDQALNLVTRLSDTSYASIASRTSADLDASDAMDDLDVATAETVRTVAPGRRDSAFGDRRSLRRAHSRHRRARGDRARRRRSGLSLSGTRKRPRARCPAAHESRSPRLRSRQLRARRSRFSPIRAAPARALRGAWLRAPLRSDEPRGRWCSTVSCGNRIRAARHRDRSR